MIFQCFPPESQAEDADAAASQLLDLLGWRHAKTGSKAFPFKQAFQVLGCWRSATVGRGKVDLKWPPFAITQFQC